MPAFAYRGVSLDGKSVTGTLEADTARSARARLRDRGILASDIREAELTGVRSPWSFSLSRRVPAPELARALRQLATLLAAGIPLVDALASLRNRRLRPAMAAALDSIRADVIGGSSFAAAVARHPGVFPAIYSGMIRAGEGSGGLDSVLAKIADHAEANARLQSRLRAALTYPTIMMLVGGGVVSFLLAYVVPQITRVFLEANQALPLPTRLLMGMSELVAGYALYGLALLAAVVLGLRYWSRTETGARRLERVVFALPWVGTVVRNVAMARFAHTLSTMVSGGMPLVDALDISRSVTGSALLGDVLEEAKTAVSEGESLAGHLERCTLFNAMVVDMIAVGERSGDLEKMLGKAAEALDEEVRGNVETMAGVLEPLMILVMAGVVLFVVLAVLLPVFEMNQLVR